MNGRKVLLMSVNILFLIAVLSSCKAKTCDSASNADSSRSKSRVKNVGLFSKKEMRRKRW